MRLSRVRVNIKRKSPERRLGASDFWDPEWCLFGVCRISCHPFLWLNMRLSSEQPINRLAKSPADCQEDRGTGFLFPSSRVERTSVATFKSDHHTPGNTEPSETISGAPIRATLAPVFLPRLPIFLLFSRRTLVRPQNRALE